MKRIKRHNVKQEMPETSSSRRDEEHDLAYYIHDRVELMHQVFSVIKTKELKAMAPECVRHISIDDLQELCTEELLGISSKRLCAILDGAPPPSDTESSSSEPMETISLDSISSDEEILSEPSSKNKKHKHKKHGRSRRHKRKTSKHTEDQDGNEDEDRSRASRAGLTVLQLLELQARARAIRAQLQQDASSLPPERTESLAEKDGSSDEVEIKEEPAEVVEISSEDEKPKIEDLMVKSTSSNANDVKVSENTKTVTKRVNDLIVTVPQSKQSRKIKLNRNNSIKTATVIAATTNGALDKTNTNNSKPQETATTDKNKEADKPNEKAKENDKSKDKEAKKVKTKKKQKKKDKKKEKDGSDHDEITLQLSDTEKMDLLEDLDGKNYDIVSSSSSEDSESSSESESDNDTSKASENDSKEHAISEPKEKSEIETENAKEKDSNTEASEGLVESNEKIIDSTEKDTETIVLIENDSQDENESEKPVKDVQTNDASDGNSEKSGRNVIEGGNNELTITISNAICDTKASAQSDSNTEKQFKENNQVGETKMAAVEQSDVNKDEQIEEGEITNNPNGKDDHSEGEISDRTSPEPEKQKPTEVLTTSNDETKGQKKKKKKDKKCKKEKKSKKSKSDFREGADENFYSETELSKNNTNTIVEDPDVINIESPDELKEKPSIDKNIIEIVQEDDDDINEVLELSDDSSCYEVEGVSVLSKEPTAEEIAALSAKIDLIDTDDDTTEEKSEQDNLNRNREGEIENISWRDRYLDSKKVKLVLNTANILNALRKKNKDLKRKMEESKKMNLEVVEENVVEKEVTSIDEGSIEHFNTLEGSTKYVNPVTENIEENLENNGANVENKQVTKEMEKDAKQLLKMYKKLLKYNDMNRQRDPNKKKKKKHKKNKEKDKNIVE